MIQILQDPSPPFSESMQRTDIIAVAGFARCASRRRRNLSDVLVDEIVRADP